VSAKDPAASYFANFTAQGVERFLRENPSRFGTTPKNILLAAALFETLNLYGINYVVDPSSSFIELSENASALDSLNYPYQTLFYRGGDCDDLSILFCSLLEALGIESAFVTVPGHIYIAFNTGVLPQGDAVNKGQQVKGAIEHEGRLWLPVEITIPRGGFLNAVETGAKEWNGAGGGEQSGIRALYPMRESWRVYRSVSVPGAGDRMPEMPNEEEILRVFANSMTQFIGK
jgi:hypothetical protein